MKFLAIIIVVHGPDPITGVQRSTHDRFREVVDNAILAEQLGFDGFGVGERPFISSADSLTLFQDEIAPVLNRSIPDPPWPAPADRLTGALR